MVRCHSLIVVLIVTGFSLSGWADTDIIARWSFDEGKGTVLHDWSGNGHDGTIVGAPQWVDGISGKALLLDGIDDFAVIPDHDAFTNQSALSVEVWTKLRSYGTHPAACFVLKWGAGGSADDSWHIATHNYSGGGVGCTDWIYRPDWALSDGASRTDAYTRDPVPLGKWVHLVGTWDGDTARIYMNGELQGTRPWSKPLNNNTTALYIGRSEPPASDFVDGAIDEVTIFNRTLTATEIFEHYQSFTPGDLIAHWSFDEGEGRVLRDGSGNGHDGTIHGTPRWVDGINGKALRLDGIDDYAVVPDHDAFTNQSALSVEVWTKLCSYGTHPATCFVLKWGAGGSTDDSWHIATHNYSGGGVGCTDWIYRPDWALSDGASRTDAYTRDPIPLGKWVHLVGTWNGDTARIYMNGELQGTRPWSKPLNNNTTALYIGRSEPPASDFVDGAIDEVKLYNRALSATEISSYCKSGKKFETHLAGGKTTAPAPKAPINVSGGKVLVRVKNHGSKTVSLIDMTGKRVRGVCGPANGEYSDIPVSNLPAGMYLVQIAAGSSTVNYRIFIAGK